MKKRREARIIALEILYQQEITSQPLNEIMKTHDSLGKKFDEFSKAILTGVENNLSEIFLKHVK